MKKKLSAKLVAAMNVTLGNQNYSHGFHAVEDILELIHEHPKYRLALIEFALENWNSKNIPANDQAVGECLLTSEDFEALCPAWKEFFFDKIDRWISQGASVSKVAKEISKILAGEIGRGDQIVIFSCVLLADGFCPYIWLTGNIPFSNEDFIAFQNENREILIALSYVIKGEAGRFLRISDEMSYYWDLINNAGSPEKSFMMMLHLIAVTEKEVKRELNRRNSELLELLEPIIKSFIVISGERMKSSSFDSDFDFIDFADE